MNLGLRDADPLCPPTAAAAGWGGFVSENGRRPSFGDWGRWKPPLVSIMWLLARVVSCAREPDNTIIIHGLGVFLIVNLIANYRK